MGTTGNEQWLNGWGQAIASHDSPLGGSKLTSLERLIHSLRSLSTCMRSSGDLSGLSSRDPACLDDGLLAARDLDLPRATAFFGLTRGALEMRFFELFDDLCAELRAI